MPWTRILYENLSFSSKQNGGKAGNTPPTYPPSIRTMIIATFINNPGFIAGGYRLEYWTAIHFFSGK